jgi:hypothetical protein
MVSSRPNYNFALPTSTSFISATSKAIKKRETALEPHTVKATLRLVSFCKIRRQWPEDAMKPQIAHHAGKIKE